MNKPFQAFAYAFLVIVGGFMFGFTSDGHIIKICIACNFWFANVIGVIAMVTGIAGLIGTISSGKRALNSNLRTNV